MGFVHLSCSARHLLIVLSSYVYIYYVKLFVVSGSGNNEALILNFPKANISVATNATHNKWTQPTLCFFLSLIYAKQSNV